MRFFPPQSPHSRVRGAVFLVCTLAINAFAAVPADFFSTAGCVTGKVVAAENGSYNGCGPLYFWDLSETSPVRKRLTDKKGHEPMISPDGKLVAWSGQSGWGDTVWICRLEENAVAVLVAPGCKPHWWVEQSTGKLYVTYCLKGDAANFPDGCCTYKQEINPTTLAKIGNRVEIQFGGKRHNMRGGLSFSGRYFAGSYAEIFIWDFNINDTILFATNLCNPSISPSADAAKENRIMFLNHDHLSLGVRGTDGFGKDYVPGGPVQSPEWSTHFRFMTFTGADNPGNGPIRVVRFNDSGIEDTYTINGSYSYHHLWVQEESSSQQLNLSASHLDFTYTIGQAAPPQQAIDVSVGSGAVMGLEASEDAAWLSVSVSGNTITNSIDVSGLNFSQQLTAPVTVSADGAQDASYAVNLRVIEPAVLTAIEIMPTVVEVQPGDKVQFLALAKDQNGEALQPQPSFSWQVDGGGTIDASGLFVAGTQSGGTHTVAVSAGGRDTTAVVSIAASAPVHLKVNCGGGTVADWLADTYSTGTSYTFGSTHDLSGVYAPAPNEVYQVVKRGDPVYTFPSNMVPDGSYLVRLHFTDKEVEVGFRLMTVSIESSTVLRLFDPYTEAGGPYRALIKEFTTTVEDGDGMSISFAKGEGDDAFVAGIEIIGLSVEAPPKLVTLHSPGQGETYWVGDTLHVKWTTDTSEVKQVDLKVSVDGGLSFHYIVNTSIWITDSEWSDFEWVIPETLYTSDGPVYMVSDEVEIMVIEYSDVPSDGSGRFRIVPKGADVKTPKGAAATLLRETIVARPDGSGGLFVSIPFANARHSVEVVAIDGRAIARRTGSGAKVYVISEIQTSGLYLVNVVCGFSKYSRVVLVKR